jgi:hypothetical protein
MKYVVEIASSAIIYIQSWSTETASVATDPQVPGSIPAATRFSEK